MLLAAGYPSIWVKPISFAGKDFFGTGQWPGVDPHAIRLHPKGMRLDGTGEQPWHVRTEVDFVGEKQVSRNANLRLMQALHAFEPLG